MNELCFIWGPPLSGQRRWMAMASDESDEGVTVSLMPLLDLGGAVKFTDVLAKLESCIRNYKGQGRHNIYCELPWEMTQEGFLFEDWLGENPFLKSLQEAAIDKNPWNISFLCCCPEDAERLPEFYRRGMEEFARASQSSVLVISHLDGDEMPAWLGTDILDFGSRLEVFHEPLWEGDIPEFSAEHYFTNVENFTQAFYPLKGDRAKYGELLESLAEGDYGAIWGAEVLWINETGDLDALSLSQGKVHHWSSSHHDLIAQCAANGASLSVVGFPLRLKDLQTAAVNPESFC